MNYLLFEQIHKYEARAHTNTKVVKDEKWSFVLDQTQRRHLPRSFSLQLFYVVVNNNGQVDIHLLANCAAATSTSRGRRAVLAEVKRFLLCTRKAVFSVLSERNRSSAFYART